MMERAQLIEKLKEQWRPFHEGKCHVLSGRCECHLCLIDELDKFSLTKDGMQAALMSRRKFALDLNEEIPRDVLKDILMVYEFGKREDIGAFPDYFICKRDGRFWTTWTKIFDLRDHISEFRKKIAAKG